MGFGGKSNIPEQYWAVLINASKHAAGTVFISSFSARDVNTDIR